MRPIVGKTYQIKYIDPDDNELSYVGNATCLELECDETENKEDLHLFSTPDNVLNAMFTEDDIIKEIK